VPRARFIGKMPLAHDRYRLHLDFPFPDRVTTNGGA